MCALAGADGGRVLYLDLESVYDTDQHLAAAALQGLMNRHGAKVFLNTGRKHWVAGINRKFTEIAPEDLEKYRGSDDYFKEYYATAHDFVFIALDNVDQLARQCSDVIDGIVIYDPKTGLADKLLAATIAGVCNAVPVTEGMLKNCP